MYQEANEAGLDMCDMRMQYSERKTSTPTRERICSTDNVSCWDQGLNFEVSAINSREMSCESLEDPFPPPLINSPISITLSTDTEVSMESRPEADYIDLSYGGQWAMTPPDSHLRRGLYDFGISIFDSSSDQVSFKNERSDQSLIRIVPNQMSKDRDQKNHEIENIETLKRIKSALRPVERFYEEEKDILERKVCHKKSKDELKKEKDNNINLDDFRTKRLRILTNNTRGFYSKKESIQSILYENKIDVALFVETFFTASKHPQLPGYVTYYRNREERAAGGVAIMIRKELSKYVVKTDVGKSENEFLVLKITNTKPNVVFIVYYGVQSGTFGTDTVKLHLSQLFEVVRKYKDSGCSINLCGDFNVHIGDSVLKGNHPDSNPNGRLFMRMLDLMGLSLMNTRSPDPVTFVDRSDKNHKRVCLDFVITNHPERVFEFVTDDSAHEFTPFSVQMRKKVASRTYADHFAIMYEFETAWQDRVKFEPESFWNYKKKMGNIRFDLFTNNACNYLLNKIESESDINAVQKAFESTITKGLFQSYGRRTLTDKKVTRVNDQLVWRQRLSDIDKLHKEFLQEKETNRIYKTKKAVLKGQKDRQNVAVEKEGSDEVLEDLEEIIDYVLSYNVENMDKVEPSDRVKEIIERKAEVIKLMLSDENISDLPQEIPWETYMKVLRKVMTQNKACFRNFNRTGQRFKYATYVYLNRMYRDEDFPDRSAITWLTKIWKRKGPESKLKNNRFVHGKEPFAKLMEKCLVAMISEQLDEATPQLQAGSRKGRSTRDQLLKVIVMQKYHESKGKPLPVLLVDVQACFDRMRLDDVIYDTIEANANLKATRALRKFSDRTIIKLRGDTRNNGEGVGRLVTGTLGQGSNFAPPGIGLTSSKSLKSELKDSGHLMARVGSVESSAQSYVDDTAAMPKNEKSLKVVCEKIGDALETISLQSHPEKTEIIVSGRNKKAEAMRQSLTENPAKMQKHDVKVVSSGMYLGMRLSQEGFRDSIDQTVQHRITKAWGKVAEIKAVINDGRMRRLGWLRSGITLIRSSIIPALTYPADVWFAMNKATEKTLKDAYKSMIYVTLDITTNTKWTSVLADLGLPNIMAVVDKLRINFISHTLWGDGDEKLRDMLREEHKELPKNSVLTIADEICRKYGIPKVSEMKIDKGLVKRQIKVADETGNWINNLRSSATQNVGLERKRLATNFYKLTKRGSQALVAYNAGALKLKTAWGDYHKNQDCLAPLCDGRDDLDHIKKCPQYSAVWKEEYNKDSKLLSKYLVEVDKERRRRFKGECLF